MTAEERAALVERAEAAYWGASRMGYVRPDVRMAAAIDLIRADVLEEAARVADDHVFGGAGVAAALRALKEKAHDR